MSEVDVMFFIQLKPSAEIIAYNLSTYFDSACYDCSSFFLVCFCLFVFLFWLYWFVCLFVCLFAFSRFENATRYINRCKYIFRTFIKCINSVIFQFDSEWAEQQEQEALDESEHRKKMQMWEAASRGDVEKVEKLAHIGVDINVANEVI